MLMTLDKKASKTHTVLLTFFYNWLKNITRYTNAADAALKALNAMEVDIVFIFANIIFVMFFLRLNHQPNKRATKGTLCIFRISIRFYNINHIYY